MAIALTRALSPRISECQLTFLGREPIDPARAAAQHDAYERLLQKHGCALVHVDPAPDHPDGVFVEDAAVVVDEVAVITRPGAESRRGETDSVAKVLARYRPLLQIEEPATIDGGDVLRAGRKVFVGRSQRTNSEGIDQLRNCLSPFGYQVIATAFRGCLHLKSAVTMLDEKTLLFNPMFVDAVSGFDMVAVASDEPHAANVLRVGEWIIAAAEHPRTGRLLEERGYNVDRVVMSELMKAEAGVTCCSVVFDEG